MVDKKLLIKETKDTIKETKFVQLEAMDADEESVFVKIQGWRMRVYFLDKKISPLDYIHRTLKIEYEGDITDPISLKLLQIKL